MLEGLLTRSSEFYAYVYFGSLIAVALAESAMPRRRLGDTTALRWVNNIAISLLDSLVLRAVFPVAAIGWATLCDQQGWGLLNLVSAPAVLSWTLAIVVLDFATYGQHYLLHRIPVLWRLHRTHHSDVEYDLTTGVRFHPIEGLFITGVQFVTIYLIGASPAMVFVTQVLFLISGFAGHANVRVSPALDRAVRTIFVTPDMHRIHHSLEMRESQSNLSNLFSWWDRLFRTYMHEPAAGHDRLEFGLREFSGRKHSTLPWMLVQPFLSDSEYAAAVGEANHEGADRKRLA